MSMSEAKSFDIAKREVWEAYKRVKANRGAAGVDGVGITEFERDLGKTAVGHPLERARRACELHRDAERSHEPGGANRRCRGM